MNDKPAHLYQTNYAFQGVAVPPGRSRIVLEFWPASLMFGAGISFCAITLIGSMLVWSWWRRLPRQGEDEHRLDLRGWLRPGQDPGIRHETSDHSRWRSRHAFTAIYRVATQAADADCRIHPILEIIIRQLARAGFEHVTLTVNYQAEIFRAYFGDGSKWRIRIDYSLETQPLNTMGPLRLIPDLPDNFLVMNGDVLTDLDFSAFLSEHIESRRLFTISAAAREQRIDYGVLHVGQDGLLSAFEEKPTTAYLVSMGIYALNRRVVDWIPSDRSFGFDELIIELLAKGQPVFVRAPRRLLARYRDVAGRLREGG